MKRHLHEEIQEHIHQAIASEINEEIIRIKIHHRDLGDQSAEQQAKIMELRKKLPEPQWAEMIDLLERAHLELIQCRQPYRLR